MSPSLLAGFGREEGAGRVGNRKGAVAFEGERWKQQIEVLKKSTRLRVALPQGNPLISPIQPGCDN